jgi:uncharacterized protein YjbI with pentapeptide repeats
MSYIIKNRFNGNTILENTADDANLHGANLHGADLHGADLRGANLHGAKYGENETLLKYMLIGPIGSRNDYLQIFQTDKQTICRTGCFTGTPAELAARTDRVDYRAALLMITTLTTQEVTP